MKLSFRLDQVDFVVDVARGLVAARGGVFDEHGLGVERPAFGLPHARTAFVEVGGQTLAVARGASVNCRVWTTCPHANGTHTECVFHILDDKLFPVDGFLAMAVPLAPFPTTVLRPHLATLASSDENYAGTSAPEDVVITRRALEDALIRSQPIPQFLRGLAIVVDDTAAAPPSHSPFPYFTDDAMQLIGDWNVEHLLTTTPSIDRADDGGTTPNHRRFWSLSEKTDRAALSRDALSRKTVTELVDGERLLPGNYLCQIQLAALDSDAAPSRPLFWRVDDENRLLTKRAI